LFSECDSARPRAVTIEIGFQPRPDPDATGEGVLSITRPATMRSLAKTQAYGSYGSIHRSQRRLNGTDNDCRSRLNVTTQVISVAGRRR